MVPTVKTANTFIRAMFLHQTVERAGRELTEMAADEVSDDRERLA